MVDRSAVDGEPIVFGYCMQGSHHRCPGVLTDATKDERGRRAHVRCSCECSHDLCGDCKRSGTEKDPNTNRCEDRRDCEDHLSAARIHHPGYKIVQEIREQPKATTRRRGRTMPKSEGTCEFSGAPTKGGRFTPGGDAKLKSYLLKEGTVEACAEMIARGWFRDDIHTEAFGGEDQVAKAEEVVPDDDEKRDEWLQKTTAKRIDKMKKTGAI